MNSRRLVPILALLLAIGLSSAEAVVPAVKTPIPARNLVAGGAPQSIHLRDHFELPGVVGPVVQFDSVSGKYNVELLANDTPKTVANFLGYLNRGAYTNSIVHRSVPGFVIQGGGFTLNGSSLNPVPTEPPVQNESKFSNTRGTIAMAKTDAGPDTATSQWFINLANNSSPLDTTNGGYTVFGRVLGTGMSVVDAIAALQVYDFSAELGASFKELPLKANALTAANFEVARSIRVVPIHPELGSATSVISYTASSANPNVVTTEVGAAALTLRPVAVGNTTVTVRGIDTNGNAVETSFAVTVNPAPLFTTQPATQTFAAGSGGNLTVAATGGATYQWQRNGANLSGVVNTGVAITNMQPSIAGLYTVTATVGGTTTTSAAAILGVSTSSKVIGSGIELEPRDIRHPNGNTFDQVLLTGTSAAITADHSSDPALTQITRMSYIDLDNDIVQIELSGPGTLSVLLDEATGPAVPVNYNQPSVSYMKGHASIVIAGATEQTHVSVFTVGRATAFDPTGGFNFLLPISSENNPANNGNAIFQGHTATTYDGLADISRISISSANGKFGGIRAANVSFYDIKGLTGIYAPGVAFEGPVFLYNISAYGSATPVFIIGSNAGETRITGGNLFQNNGQPVQINGLTQLKFTAGSDSHGNALPARLNQAILHQNGVNVTSQIVVNP